jgi:amidohydrolase
VSEKRAIVDAACRMVDGMKSELLELSHYIYANPELAFHEAKASARLEEFLVKSHFSVKRGSDVLSTALLGRRPPREGINLGFISEYDALSIGHACGHNLIATTGVAAAVVFDRIASEYGLPANAVFLGTPAEEGGGGKILMLEAGFFDGIDYAMMIHPADRTMVEDWSLAGQKVNIRYYGKSAHCAASPWLGANALAAAEQTFSLVNAWRCQFKDYSRVHGIIVKGGEATNVIPDYAEVQINVRSDQRDYMDELMRIVLNCAECAAKAFGVETRHDCTLAYEPISNSKIIEKYMGESFTALGEMVMPRMRTHGIGSTDMGNVSQRVPAIHGHLKLVEANTHTVEFRDAAGGEAGDRYVMTATKAMVMTAIGLATDPRCGRERRANDSRAIRNQG